MKTITIAVAAALLAAVAGSHYARHEVRWFCDQFGAVKLGHDVYECKREKGVS